MEREEQEIGLGFTLFGGFTATCGDRILRFARTTCKPLLARLILAKGNSISRDELADWLFSPDINDRKGSLAQALTACRQGLGEVHSRRIISPTLECVKFNVEGISCDVLDFNRLINRMATTDVEKALLLYKGPFLAGFEDDGDEAWIDATRVGLATQYYTKVLPVAQNALNQGDPNRALTYLASAWNANRDSEDLLRLMMEALEASGKPKEALEICIRHQEWTRTKRNHDIEIETKQLYSAIRERL